MPLVFKGYVGIPDVLVKRKGKSKLGDFHYVVKEIKSAKTIKKYHVMQAMFYNFILGKVQGFTPEEANGKRILRYAHLMKVKDILETKNGFVNAYNYDGNGSASPGSTFYNPTLSLRSVIAKLHKNENWVDLLSVD